MNVLCNLVKPENNSSYPGGSAKWAFLGDLAELLIMCLLVMEYFELSDSELLLRLKRNDGIAFNTIYHRHASDLFKYISGKVDTRHDCDEILIDVFLALWNERLNIEVELTEFLSATLKFRLFQYAKDHPESELYNHLKKTFYENKNQIQKDEED